MVHPARTRRVGPRRGRGDSEWRFGASLAMLLAVALGAGLLTAGFTLPPPLPPQPPAAPAGDLGDIPGFLPDTAAGDDATADRDPGGQGSRDTARGGRDAEQGWEPAATGEPPVPGADVAGAAGADPAPTRGRGLTATRAPAAPPPIPPVEPDPADTAAPVGNPTTTAGGVAGSRDAAPRPGGPPMPRAGDPLAPAPAADRSGTPSGRAGAGTPALPALTRSEPRRIGIPSIGVDAEVIGVGIDSRGELEVPPLEKPMLAGWYRLGPSPGESGNSVIVGHVDSRKKGPAVFFNMGRLKKGDLITVTRADGSVVRFAIDDVRLFPKSSFPSHAVYGAGEQSRLRIVTCGGRYDRSVRDYLDNVVAFASRVS